MTDKNRQEIEEIIKEVMQGGFEVAMGGDIFKSEEENKEWQLKAYDDYVKEKIDVISELIKRREREASKVTGETSDGYHTFSELYEFRKLYNAGFFNQLPKECGVHKSKKHSDGELCFGGGWFIVTAYLTGKQISNHYELKDWGLFHCEERELADVWDGHTAQDVVKRLYDYLKDAGEDK